MKRMFAGTLLAAVVIVAGSLLPTAVADDKKAKPEKVEFTKDEAKFLAHLSDQAELITVMKLTLRVVDAADTAWPTKPSDLAEYLVKKSIEIVFDAPKVEDAIKNLETIKRKAQANEINLFIEKGHPAVNGAKASAPNRKYFKSLVEAYLKK